MLTVAGFGYLLIVIGFLGSPGYWYLPAWPPVVVVPLVALWGAAYLLAFFSFRRRIPNPSLDTKPAGRIPGRRLAVTSATLISVAFVLIELLVFFPLRASPCNGHSACLIPTNLPFTLGLLSPSQILMSSFALILAGTILLTIAIWRNRTWASRSPPTESGQINSPTD
jgi:hypothetical protein